MKTVAATLLICLAFFSTAFAETSSVQVAQVDYREIEDLLIQVVLHEKDNEALRKRYLSKEAAAKAAQEKMQAAIMKGKRVDPREAASSFLHNDADKDQVDLLSEKYLLTLIERVFDGKYEMILKEGYRSSLVYTRVPIDDVTVVIKQELLKALPNQ